MAKQARNRSREARNAAALAQRRSRKRNRLFATGGSLVIVGLLVAIVISVVNATGKAGPRVDTASPRPLVTPAIATAAGAIAVGNADAPVRLEVYLDYMCPYCGRFERANSDEIERLVAAGTARLELYPLSFLDKTSSGTRYSTRAANAVATVADRAPGSVLAFNKALFARQPAEGTSGLSDGDIATLATNAGVPRATVDAFPDRIFESWVAASTTAVFKSGVSGTPTVKINGVVFDGDLYTAGPLTRAVTAAKGQ